MIEIGSDVDDGSGDAVAVGTVAVIDVRMEMEIGVEIAGGCFHPGGVRGG